MNQNIWGSSLWFSLHTISMNYPNYPSNEDKMNYKDFFISLKNVIPCTVCKKNYIRHLKENPIDGKLNTRKDLVYWLIDMHNMVNAEIGKKQMSYDAVIQKYESIYSKKIFSPNNIENFESNLKKNNKMNYLLVLLLIFILIVVYYYYLRKKL
jgi:hypothetical protein